MNATATPHLNVSELDQTPPTTRRADVTELQDGLRWARSLLDDPLATSVHASGMSASDLKSIEQAAGGSS